MLRKIMDNIISLLNIENIILISEEEVLELLEVF